MEQELELATPNIVQKFVNVELKAVNKAEREILHLITTPVTDRAGDIVETSGAEIANFMKNPIVMADHGRSIDKVVGRALALEVSDKGIHARTKFRDTPLAREAFALVAEGLGGWSIGFRPIDVDPIKSSGKGITGLRFSKWELLEYSIVPIPCNQDIVQNAITKGLVTADNVSVFFATSDSVVPAIAAADGPTAEPTKGAQINPELARIIVRYHAQQVYRAAAEKMLAEIRSAR